MPEKIAGVRAVFGILSYSIDQKETGEKVEKKANQLLSVSVVIIDLFITINTSLRTKRADGTSTNAREIKFHTRLLLRA